VPLFQWKGRTRDGHQIEGKLDARSKEDVLSRLRAQGLTVTSVDEGRDSGEPPDPDPSPQMPEGRPKPTRLRGLLATIALVAIAVLIGAMAPIVFCSCERAGGSVTCTINDRILGVVPMRDQTLAGVVRVDTETEFWRERRGTSSGIERAKRRIVLHDAAGKTIRPFGWDQGGTLGATSDAMQTDIDRFLDDKRRTSIRLWQGQWVPLLMPAILLLLAVMMIGLICMSFSETATNRFYDRIEGWAEKARARRKLHRP